MSIVNERVKNYLSGLALFALLLLLPTYRLYDLESNVFDSQMKAKYLLADVLLPSDHPPIALVLVDDEARRLDTSRRLVRISPMSRSYLADVVNRIQEIQPKPKIIGLDFVLDSPSAILSGDEALASALQSAREKGVRVVVATRLVQTGGLQRPLLPIPGYLEGGQLATGHTHMLVSLVDDVIRKAEVAVRVVDAKELARLDQRGLSDQLGYYEPCGVSFCYWSFSAAVALAAYPEAMRERLHKLRTQGPFWIDFSTPQEMVFASYSSSQLLEGKLKRQLSHKIVLVGAAYTDSYDRARTPLSVSSFPVGRFWAINPVLKEHLSGIEVHAYALHSLLAIAKTSNGILRVGEMIPVIAGFLSATFVLIVTTRFQREFWSFLTVPLLPLAYVLVATILFQKYSIYLPIVRALAAYVAVIGMAHFVRIAATKK